MLRLPPALGPTLVLLFCALAACASAPDGDSPPEAESRALRVLTYNLHHGEGTDGVLDLERVAKVIESASPDLVALQEVDRGCTRTGGVDQLAWLAERLELHASFAKFMDFQGGEYGLGILSRFEPLEAWTIELPPGEREPRAAAAIRVASPLGGEVVFVSAHLDWLEDDTARLAQAEALLAALEAEPNVVLAGDLNDVPGSRTLDAFDAALLRYDTEVYCRFIELRRPETFPSHGPDRQIDFVLHRHFGAEWKERYETDWSYPEFWTTEVLDVPVVSDHRPVFAELRPPGRQDLIPLPDAAEPR